MAASSGGERQFRGRRETFIDSLFAGSLPQLADQPIGRPANAQIIAAGGFPEAVDKTASRRLRFFESYLASNMERDLRDIASLVDNANARRLLDNLVIERHDGSMVAIEIKSAASVHARDVSGMKYLREKLGQRFVSGTLLDTGSATIPLSDRVAAVPLAGPWEGGPPGPYPLPHGIRLDPQQGARPRVGAAHRAGGVHPAWTGRLDGSRAVQPRH